jgi:hypothetical protein
MGYFVGKLSITPSGSKHWILTESLLYVNNNARKIQVPAGFKFDGASIPRGLWSFVGHPLNGKHARAAVIHDYMYFTGVGGKEEADKTFLEAMKVDGVSKIRRTLMYWAVKYFGGSAYESYR